MPRNRPKPDKWLEPNNLLLLQYKAMSGETKAAIAEFMGISVRTLEHWEKKPECAQLKQAISAGVEASCGAVSNRLYRAAMDGNITAMIFYLKNRDPSRWSDHPELRGMNGKVVFVDDIPAVQPKQNAKEPEPGDQTEQPDHS